MWNIFLQILDEGRITDGKGRTIDMKNTIIIMTSNIGSHLLDENNEKNLEKKMREELKKFFRIEFINRIDEIIIFRPLSHESVLKIASILLREVQSQLLEREINLTFDASILE